VGGDPPDLRSAPPGIPLAGCHVSCWPMGTCDVRGVMLASASRPLPASRVPPSPEVPSGKTPRQHYPTQSQVPFRPFPSSSRASPHSWLALLASPPLMSIGESRAAVPACPRLRSASPPPDFAATANPRALWQRSTQK
jgi:hypothetical protein